MSEIASKRKTGICKLKLTNFRCYSSLFLEVETSSPVILTGNNGSGKTNMLEALSFLVPGRGLRHARFSDVAMHHSEIVLGQEDNISRFPSSWGVSAKVISPLGEFDIGTGCEGGKEGLERRQVRINGQVAKSQSELGDIMSAVWLTPAMDRIFCGEATQRRRFLDRLVQAFDSGHAGRTTAYSNAYKQWGRLLREGCKDAVWLRALENTMSEYGVAVAAARRDLILRLQPFLLEGGGEFPRAEVSLSGDLENLLGEEPALTVEDIFRERLERSRKIFADGGYISGPHQTDLEVMHEKGIRASLCSTGEQKALLVSIIIAHSKAQIRDRGVAPVMLLDEVTAHLDKKRREALFSILVKLNSQVWLTGTDIGSFSSLYGLGQFFDIDNAEVSAAVA